MPLVDTLAKLGAAALPALPMVTAAAEDRSDEYRSESCRGLLEQLRREASQHRL
jgi:hypothetical protein